MPPIRILVVDDSIVIRRVLSEALASDPAVEIVGTASDGRLALAKIPQLSPDLITLDVEMPNMTGLETVKEIRKLRPHLPIIMFSTLTERGAATTLDALALGASDYVTKPSNTGSLDLTMLRIREELLPKIKALCRNRAADKRTPVAPALPPKKIAIAERGRAHIEILAIGTSTGGPNALAEVIPAIPVDFPIPIVIVQHMPPLFTRMLAERLDKDSAISVHEGEPGRKLEPGHAWIAPGDYHMVLERRAAGVYLAMTATLPKIHAGPPSTFSFAPSPPPSAPTRLPSSSPEWVPTACSAPKPCAKKAAASTSKTKPAPWYGVCPARPRLRALPTTSSHCMTSPPKLIVTSAPAGKVLPSPSRLGVK
jgi:two-component system chemotaxis response regulator CheB